MSHLDHAELVANNRRQVEESQSDDNRYFFNQRYGRDGTDSELLIYYIENGGAAGHRQRMEDRAAQANEQPRDT